MFSCIICLDTLKGPVALPCGHVFCYGCIERIVTTIKPFTSQHCCPSCRRPYTISTVDPSMVPDHLQPYIFAPIRRLYLDLSPSPPPANSEASTSQHRAPVPVPSETDTVKAENLALRAHVEMWKRRAEVHSAANLGLVNLAKMARDYAVNLKHERDVMEREMRELRRRLGEDAGTSDADSSNDSHSGQEHHVKHEPFDIPSLLATSPIPIPLLHEPAHHSSDVLPTPVSPSCNSEAPPRKRKRSTSAGPATPVRRSMRHQRRQRTSTPQVCQ